ncbi:hypothetical protein BDD12DRAFT_896980 [Trichophaea hybrida]|nr:hypothetical protein BDD12DRAFT_896980 [Trichophaea hybrida]
MDTSTSILDNYVRSAAASLALGIKGQFVGRKQLPKLCSTFLPDQITLGGNEYTKTQILARLDELLRDGLAADLDERTRTDNLVPLMVWGTHLDWCTAAKEAANNRKMPPAKNKQSRVPAEPQPPLPSTPLTIPYALQHAVLPPLQSLLEEACYNFISKRLPHILQQKSWTLPQAAELNQYVHMILIARPRPFADPAPLKNLNDIRHIAVHRTPLSEEKFYELMEVGVRAASLLGDWSTLAKIKTLRTKVEKWNEEMRSGQDERGKVQRRLKELRQTKRGIETEISKLESQKTTTEKEDRKIMRRLRAKVEDHFAPEDEDEKSDNDDGQPARLITRPRIFIVHPPRAG